MHTQPVAFQKRTALVSGKAFHWSPKATIKIVASTTPLLIAVSWEKFKQKAVSFQQQGGQDRDHKYCCWLTLFDCCRNGYIWHVSNPPLFSWQRERRLLNCHSQLCCLLLSQLDPLVADLLSGGWTVRPDYGLARDLCLHRQKGFYSHQSPPFSFHPPKQGLYSLTLLCQQIRVFERRPQPSPRTTQSPTKVQH